MCMRIIGNMLHAEMNENIEGNSQNNVNHLLRLSNDSCFQNILSRFDIELAGT